jgi:hypothetical protein
LVLKDTDKKCIYFVGSVEGERHWLRVKVSNVPGKYDRSNNFVIQMPELDYDPKQIAN